VGAPSIKKSIEQLIKTAMSLFEPLMILIMGAVILFIVLSVILPILSMDQLSGSMGRSL
jgi:general secretion pathway protein F